MKSQVLPSNPPTDCSLPTHIAYIPDGNRRWAREHGLPTLEGHRKGFKNIETAIQFSSQHGIKYTSFFLFSTENWSRSPEEVSYLMELLRFRFAQAEKLAKKHQLRYKFFGTTTHAPADIIDRLHSLEENTKHNSGSTICLCFNYGGHQEILDATNKLLKSGKTSLDSIADFENPLPPRCSTGRSRHPLLWRTAPFGFYALAHCLC